MNDADDTVYIANFGRVLVMDGRRGVLLDDTIAVLGRARQVAVDQSDDTVYVSSDLSSWTGAISVIAGATGRKDREILVGQGPSRIALDQSDDTAYVLARGSVIPGHEPVMWVIDGRDARLVASMALTWWGRDIAVDDTDDTVYVSTNDGEVLSDSGFVGVIDAHSLTVVGEIPLNYPYRLAVDQSDDTLYIGNSGPVDTGVVAYNPRNPAHKLYFELPWGKFPWISSLHGLALDQGSKTIYASTCSDFIDVMDSRDGSVSSRLERVAGDCPLIAVDGAGANQGLVYAVSTFGRGIVSVIGKVTPTLLVTSGVPGARVALELDIPQVGYDVDDTTVLEVTFDGVPAPGLAPAAGDTWTVMAPPGSGTVDVSVRFRGRLTAIAGRFTYAVAPGTPTSVLAEPGKASARVTWQAPLFDGGSLITEYTVTSTPGNRTCTWSTGPLACTVKRLVPGTKYKFTVTASNAAGTSSASVPSNHVTPLVKPGAVTSLKATARKGAIRVTWAPPTDLGGATAVTYQYRVGKQAWKPTTGTSVNVNGKKGTTVTVSLRAVNAAGAGPVSTVSATPR